MGKYFVSVQANSRIYRVCRDDISKVYSHRLRKLPRQPAFDPAQKQHEDDYLTNCEDSELQFEPMQFFPQQTVAYD
jgi:hypothetical protein